MPLFGCLQRPILTDYTDCLTRKYKSLSSQKGRHLHCLFSVLRWQLTEKVLEMLPKTVKWGSKKRVYLRKYSFNKNLRKMICGKGLGHAWRHAREIIISCLRLFIFEKDQPGRDRSMSKTNIKKWVAQVTRIFNLAENDQFLTRIPASNNAILNFFRKISSGITQRRKKFLLYVCLDKFGQLPGKWAWLVFKLSLSSTPSGKGSPKVFYKKLFSSLVINSVSRRTKLHLLWHPSCLVHLLDLS